MKTKEMKGITLVALVITIVVLLILAGVSINTVLGDDGIIKKAPSESIVTHSFLSVQLQKGAHLFLYVSHIILIPSNQKLQINYGGYYGKLHKNNYWKGKPN